MDHVGHADEEVAHLLPGQVNTWRMMQSYTVLQYSTVHYPIFKSDVLDFNLPSVFSKTDSVLLKEDTQKCIFNNTCPRACIS